MLVCRVCDTTCVSHRRGLTVNQDPHPPPLNGKLQRKRSVRRSYEVDPFASPLGGHSYGQVLRTPHSNLPWSTHCKHSSGPSTGIDRPPDLTISVSISLTNAFVPSANAFTAGQEMSVFGGSWAKRECARSTLRKRLTSASATPSSSIADSSCSRLALNPSILPAGRSDDFANALSNVSIDAVTPLRPVPGFACNLVSTRTTCRERTRRISSCGALGD